MPLLTPNSNSSEDPTKSAGRGEPPLEARTLSLSDPRSKNTDYDFDHVDGFEVIRQLGHGGNGVVFLVQDRELPRRLALKLIKESRLTAAGLERFRREAEAMARLNHPHVARVIHYACAGPFPYFTTEYFAGGSLVDQLEEYQSDERRAVAVVCQVAEAVQYLHDQHLVHRDVKPHNVFLDERGNAYLGDLGLVRDWSSDSNMTQTDAVVGTPAYMSPEQAKGQRACIGPQSDIYSLGVMLYELLTKKRPPSAYDPECTRLATTYRPMIVRPEVDPVLERIVLHCLEFNPGDRYASAAVLAEDLTAWLLGREVPLRRPPRRVRVSRWLRRHWLPLAVSIFVVLAGAAVGYSVWRTRPSELERIQHSLERDGHVTLLDADRSLQWHEWPVGPVELQPRSDEAFTGFATDSGAMLELVRGLSDPGVTITIQMKQDPSSKGIMGVYAGRSSQETPLGPVHCFVAVTIADRGKEAFSDRDGTVTFRAMMANPRSPEGFGSAPVINDKILPIPSDGWRTVSLAISRNLVSVTVDDTLVGEISRSALLNSAADMGTGFSGFRGLTPTFSPQEGIGLLAYRSRVLVRSVILTRRAD